MQATREQALEEASSPSFGALFLGVLLGCSFWFCPAESLTFLGSEGRLFSAAMALFRRQMPLLRRGLRQMSTFDSREISDEILESMLKGKQDLGLVRELMNARVHMGHRTHLTYPAMFPYILGERNGMHVLNLDKTVVMLRRAMGVLREMVANDCSVMWCCPNDEEVYKTIAPLAEKANAYLLRGRWVIGTLTNPLETLQGVRYARLFPVSFRINTAISCALSRSERAGRSFSQDSISYFFTRAGLGTNSQVAFLS